MAEPLCAPPAAADEPDWAVVERLAAGERIPATTAEVAAAAIALRRRGLSSPAIAECLGEHQRQVDRWISRHRTGRPLVTANQPRRIEATPHLTLAQPAPVDRQPQVVRARVGRLRVHPHNVRSDLGDLRSLTASIKAHGVLCPLMAYQCGDHFRLLHGHRRLAAAQLAGLRSVPVVVVPEHEDDEAITLMLAENLVRAQLRHDDRRAAIRTLLDEHGHTATGIAARLGVSPDTVRRWATDERPRSPKPRRQRVDCAAVLRLVDQWTGRAAHGLTPDQAHQLFAELTNLATPS